MTSVKISTGCYDSKTYISLTAVAVICAAAFGLPSIAGVLSPAVGLTVVPSTAFGVSGFIAMAASSFNACIRNWGLWCLFLIVSRQDSDFLIISNRCIGAAFLLAVSVLSPKELLGHLSSVLLAGGLLLFAYGTLRMKAWLKYLAQKHVHPVSEINPVREARQESAGAAQQEFDGAAQQMSAGVALQEFDGAAQQEFDGAAQQMSTESARQEFAEAEQPKSAGAMWQKKKRFLGGGDVKLLLVLGLFLNPGQVLCMFLLAGIFGLLSSYAAFLRRNHHFPFGPGICAAAAISLLCVR